MSRLSFLADEHVPSVVVAALRSNGYRVEIAKERHVEATVDSEQLADAATRELILLTNDRDFVRSEIDHSGVVIYADPEPSPGDFVRAVDRIDRHFTRETMRNNVEWLEDWLQRRLIGVTNVRDGRR